MKRIPLLFVAAILCGCAGTWSETWMTMPSAKPNPSFAVGRLPEYGQLSFENKSVSLFITQCRSGTDEGPGQLCGTLVLSPGASLEFLSDEFSMLDLAQHTERSMKIQDRTFDIGVPYVGPDEPGPGRWPAQKLYALPGKRFKFTILPEPVKGEFEIRLPNIKVNSAVLEFPTLHVFGGPGRTWVRAPV